MLGSFKNTFQASFQGSLKVGSRVLLMVSFGVRWGFGSFFGVSRRGSRDLELRSGMSFAGSQLASIRCVVSGLIALLSSFLLDEGITFGLIAKRKALQPLSRNTKIREAKTTQRPTLTSKVDLLRDWRRVQALRENLFMLLVSVVYLHWEGPGLKP